MKLINLWITIWGMMLIITMIYNMNAIATDPLAETFTANNITTKLFAPAQLDNCGTDITGLTTIDDLDSRIKETNEEGNQKYDITDVTKGGDSNTNIFDPFQKLIAYSRMTTFIGFFTGLSPMLNMASIISCEAKFESDNSIDNSNNPLYYLLSLIGTMLLLIFWIQIFKWLMGRITNTD